MSVQKIIRSDWYPSDQLIITQISGETSIAAVNLWEQTLLDALGQINHSATFKILVNLHGFQAADLKAHKRFRTIIPSILADYGWKVGYVDMFAEEAQKMVLRMNRNIRCIAAAHCHHDEAKISKYKVLFDTDYEHFFTEVDQAYNWILKSPLTR